MKKIAAFSLLAIFLFNSVGYYIVFQISQNSIKQEIKSQIRLGVDERKLTALTLTKEELNEIEWIENGKEIRFHSKFYDIVKTKHTALTTTFYCITDADEELLFSNLEDHIQRHVASNSQKNDSKKVSDQFDKNYFNKLYEFNCQTNEIEAVLFKNLNFNYSQVFLNNSSPPPEFA